MLNKLITIPEYIKTYVDGTCDIEAERSHACWFHDEAEGKSFTFSPEKGIWRCWGKCHCGGDVIDLHRLNYHLRTRDEAKKSLYAMLGYKEDVEQKFTESPAYVDEAFVKERVLIAKAKRMAKTPDRWIELDYLMSQYPLDISALEVLLNSWEV